MPASAAPTRLGLSLGCGSAPTTITSVSPEEKKSAMAMPDRAQYKIEVHFGKDRRPHGLCTGVLTIWESGLKLHGGGDDKMYWCGYKDCGKPMSSSHFGYAHTVCPTCHKEQFLDEPTRADHVKALVRDHKPTMGLERLPIVVGEKYFKLYPEGISDLLVTTFNDLGRNADFYLKYHKLDMRYNPVHETVGDLNKLDTARLSREPVIYPLKRLLTDLSTGSDLKKRILALITA